MMTCNSMPTMTSAAMAAAESFCRRFTAQMYTVAIRLDAALAASIFVVLTVAAAVVCLSVSLITLALIMGLVTLITLLVVLFRRVRLRCEYRD